MLPRWATDAGMPAPEGSTQGPWALHPSPATKALLEGSELHLGLLLVDRASVLTDSLPGVSEERQGDRQGP